jgi:hypothetical protein
VTLAASVIVATAAPFAGGACKQSSDIHQNEAQGRPCLDCHQAAYTVASRPVHVNVMPVTCESCHQTSGWTPVRQIPNHSWFPLANKHAATDCKDCHTKGYRQGDTPKDCYGCHQNDYASAQHPVHNGISTDCATCHDDAGFRPSRFVHPWPLTGKHAPTQCVQCHQGSPPAWKVSTACADCHAADYAKSTYPGHQTFPKTCTDCHDAQALAWAPAIEGPHPEAKFPLTAPSQHAGAACMDCHKPALGASKAGQNTDCIDCHAGSHQRPAIDQVHISKDILGYPSGPQPVNFCLNCHPLGQK